MSETAGDELEQIAVALDTDPHATEAPHPVGVLISAHHYALLLTLSAALGQTTDDIATEALQSGIETWWRVSVHQAEKGDREA